MTLVIMILPLIIRTTEEALMGVPDAYREASFGLGAGKLRTVFKWCFQVQFLESFPVWYLRQDVLLVRLQPDLYCRCCGEGSIQPDGIRTYPGSTYVCAFQ